MTLGGLAKDSWSGVRFRRLEWGTLKGALRGGHSEQRPEVEHEAGLRRRFEELRLVSGTAWLCVLAMIGCILVVAESVVVVAGAVGGLVVSLQLPVLWLRADWALIRLREGRSVGLVEYVGVRLGGRGSR